MTSVHFLIQDASVWWASLVILYSDELDLSAARRPQGLILGSMGSGQAIRWSWKHKNDTSRVEIPSDSRTKLSAKSAIFFFRGAPPRTSPGLRPELAEIGVRMF